MNLPFILDLTNLSIHVSMKSFRSKEFSMTSTIGRVIHHWFVSVT